MNKNLSPPKLPLRFFRWYCHPDYQEDIEGDLMERFESKVEEKGIRTAKWRFTKDVIQLFRPGIIRSLEGNYRLNSYGMFKTNIKIASRHLLKNKTFSLINIGGLAMGMTVAILIGLWIWDEVSFNTYHKNNNQIAAVLQNQNFNGEVQTWWSQAKQLAPELRESYGSNFKYVTMASHTWNHTLSYKDKVLSKSGNFMEPVAPEMLTLNMLSGQRSGLTDPHSIILAKSTALAFFGEEDPLNKTMRIDNQSELIVRGVYEDLPYNSTFSNLQFIAPWDLYAQDLPDWLEWGNSWFQTFVQIEDNADFNKVSANIKDVKLINGGEENAQMEPALFLHPMSKWHLYSEFKQGVNTGGRIQYVWLFGIIGVFVLLLACINFMNLSTARSENRAKEVGIRKAIGSYRSQLIGQFLSESLLVAVLAFGLSLLCVQLLLPYFNEVAGKALIILWSNPLFWLLGICFVLLTGVLAGSYPAFYLSSFRAVKVLKGTFRVGRYSAVPRKVLVVVQFTVSISLMIGTILVFQQIQFSKNRPMGYNYNNLITVPIKSDEIHKHYDTFRNDLLQTGAVLEVSKSASPITNMGTTNSGYDWKGKDPGMQDEFVTLRVTHEFGKTIGWEIKEGRDFSKDFATDSMGFVINEAAVAYMGLENPIGEIVKRGENETFTIIGVVKNMVTQSPYAPIRQMIFFIDYSRSNNANIKMDPNASTSESIAKIESVVKKYDPVNPFEYQFADQEYAKKFGDEERIGKLASFFAILAIFISCLGLFGMASYVAEQRTKEIGIRKVLGASVANLWRLLSKDFVALVLVSCIIAIPISYYFLDGWLQQYDYHTEISYLIFIAASVGALLLTLITVSYQAIKAATTNPVNSLRSE